MCDGCVKEAEKGGNDGSKEAEEDEGHINGLKTVAVGVVFASTETWPWLV